MCRWKCEDCDLTENLWLNLTDGSILCGRRNWDGSGGNGHAAERFLKTNNPLAVKLGTITADLSQAGEIYFDISLVCQSVTLLHILEWDLVMSSMKMGGVNRHAAE